MFRAPTAEPYEYNVLMNKGGAFQLAKRDSKISFLLFKTTLSIFQPYRGETRQQLTQEWTTTSSSAGKRPGPSRSGTARGWSGACPTPCSLWRSTSRCNTRGSSGEPSIGPRDTPQRPYFGEVLRLVLLF